MSIKIGIFLGALAFSGFAQAGQQYQQTTADVENRDSGLTAEAIILASAAQMKVKPVIPVEVFNQRSQSLMDSSFSILNARCVRGLVNGANAPDVQALARKLGIDRIVIQFADMTQEEDPTQLRSGLIELTQRNVGESLRNGKYYASTQRARDEDVLKIDGISIRIQGEGKCYTQNPANDLRTELNKKLRIMNGTAEPTNYPENLSPQRQTTRTRGQS